MSVSNCRYDVVCFGIRQPNGILLLCMHFEKSSLLLFKVVVRFLFIISTFSSKHSAAVIDWFKSLNDKNRHAFLSFTIIDFYPSISEDLLNKGLSWATNLVTITDQQIEVIMHARKSLLFNKEKPWIKKGNATSFDVTVGSYDGAEVCELAGLFILNSLEKTFGKKVGLYRGDGIVAINTSSARLADKTRKDTI